MSIRVAVFASGGGTTFQALLDHTRTRPESAWTVALLVCDRPGIGVLHRAVAGGVPTAVIPDRGRAPKDVGAETLVRLESDHIQAVCLAGYLRLVPETVVSAFEGRMLNVHPALLPAFGGKGMYGDRVHRAVLESGARISGPTVHLVDPEYDRGMPLAQWPVPVLLGDTLDTLRSRVQQAERALFPVVMDHLAAAISAGEKPAPLSLASEAFAAVNPLERPEGASAAGTQLEGVLENAFRTSNNDSNNDSNDNSNNISNTN